MPFFICCAAFVEHCFGYSRLQATVVITLASAPPHGLPLPRPYPSSYWYLLLLRRALRVKNCQRLRLAWCIHTGSIRGTNTSAEQEPCHTDPYRTNIYVRKRAVSTQIITPGKTSRSSTSCTSGFTYIAAPNDLDNNRCNMHKSHGSLTTRKTIGATCTKVMEHPRKRLHKSWTHTDAC